MYGRILNPSRSRHAAGLAAVVAASLLVLVTVPTVRALTFEDPVDRFVISFPDGSWVHLNGSFATWRWSNWHIGDSAGSLQVGVRVYLGEYLNAGPVRNNRTWLLADARSWYESIGSDIVTLEAPHAFETGSGRLAAAYSIRVNGSDPAGSDRIFENYAFFASTSLNREYLVSFWFRSASVPPAWFPSTVDSFVILDGEASVHPSAPPAPIAPALAVLLAGGATAATVAGAHRMKRPPLIGGPVDPPVSAPSDSQSPPAEPRHV